MSYPKAWDQYLSFPRECRQDNFTGASRFAARYQIAISMNCINFNGDISDTLSRAYGCVIKLVWRTALWRCMRNQDCSLIAKYKFVTNRFSVAIEP